MYRLYYLAMPLAIALPSPSQMQSVPSSTRPPPPSKSSPSATVSFFHGSQRHCLLKQRLPPRWQLSAAPEDEDEAMPETQPKEAEKARMSKSEEGTEGLEALLGREFGGLLWFSVLGAFLATFAGGYIYLVLNYADFSDVPIFRAAFAPEIRVDGVP